MFKSLMLILLLSHLHPKYQHINHMNLKIIEVHILDVVAEVAAITREAGVLPEETISKTTVKGTHGIIIKNRPASSVALVKNTTSPKIVIAQCGATNATPIHMDLARAVGYRNLRTMVWSLNIPLGGPLKNAWQFHLLPHALDFLRV